MRSVDAAAPRLIGHTEGGRVRAECSQYTCTVACPIREREARAACEGHENGRTVSVESRKGRDHFGRQAAMVGKY
jgi:hypothetical protein